MTSILLISIMLMYLELRLQEFSCQVLNQRIRGKWPHCLSSNVVHTKQSVNEGTADSIVNQLN